MIVILKEKESDKLILNFIDINLKAEKILGIKNNLEIQEIQKMLNKEIVEPIKDRIPYIALSYILMKYMIFLRNFLFNKLSEDFEQSYKRIEDIISEEFLDFGGSVIEEWSYDCTPVMEGRRVDDISLLLSLAC